MDITIPLAPAPHTFVHPATDTHDYHCATLGIPAALADAARTVLDPTGLGAPPPHVPLIPEAIRRRHAVFVPTNTRFKAAARFLQALWRTDRDLPIGIHIDRASPHRPRRLGSRISAAAGRTGTNFMTPAIASIAARALAYREPDAAYDLDRLRTNLLSSQPLAFNLFAPLAADPALAARFVAALLPTTTHLATVTDILFEHSPGRGDARFTADRTAFDVVIRGPTATGARALICIEVKYSETGADTAAPPPHPRHATIVRTVAPGLFRDPDDPVLVGPACQQLYRQHCLASSMLAAGCADTATLVFLAPAHNHAAHTTAATYTRTLTDPHTGAIPFVPATLEHAFTALAAAGLPAHARALHRRYTDWWLLDGELVITATAATAVPAPVPSTTTPTPELDPAQAPTPAAYPLPHPRTRVRSTTAVPTARAA